MDKKRPFMKIIGGLFNLHFYTKISIYKWRRFAPPDKPTPLNN